MMGGFDFDEQKNRTSASGFGSFSRSSSRFLGFQSYDWDLCKMESSARPASTLFILIFMKSCMSLHRLYPALIPQFFHARSLLARTCGLEAIPCGAVKERGTRRSGAPVGFLNNLFDVLPVRRFFTLCPRILVCVLFLDGVDVGSLPRFVVVLGFSGVLSSSAYFSRFARRALEDMLSIVLFIYRERRVWSRCVLLCSL